MTTTDVVKIADAPMPAAPAPAETAAATEAATEATAEATGEAVAVAETITTSEGVTTTDIMKAADAPLLAEVEPSAAGAGAAERR